MHWWEAGEKNVCRTSKFGCILTMAIWWRMWKMWSGRRALSWPKSPSPMGGGQLGELHPGLARRAVDMVLSIDFCLLYTRGRIHATTNASSDMRSLTLPIILSYPPPALPDLGAAHPVDPLPLDWAILHSLLRGSVPEYTIDKSR
jgi:hypothetical protein